MKSTCYQCRCWDELTSEVGLCRRYAPRPLLLTSDQQAALIANAKPEWAETSRHEWCGDFQAPEESDQEVTR